MMGTLALLAFTCTTMRALAAEPAQEQLVATRKWYGAPMVLSDLVALGVFVGGMMVYDHSQAAGAGFMVLGFGTYGLGGPIVHFSEHRVRMGFASLGLRMGAPLGFALAGALVGGVIGSGRRCGNTNDNCALGYMGGGAAVGFLVGIPVAMVVDNAVFARKWTTAKPLAVSVIPVYQPATGQTGLALRGTW
jgi:hypothetical protein